MVLKALRLQIIAVPCPSGPSQNEVIQNLLIVQRVWNIGRLKLDLGQSKALDRLLVWI